MIKTKKDLHDWISYECGHYSISILDRILLISEDSILRKHQILLRKTEYYTNMNYRILTCIYKMRLRKIQYKYGMHIPLNVCGKGLKIMHLGSILINKNSHVGDNCAFHISTALVAGGTDNNAPTLKNGVVLGIGSKVIGGVTIEENIAIGANAVVNKSFLTPDITIAGIPAKKISNNNRKDWNKK